MEMDMITQEIWRKEKMKGPHLLGEGTGNYFCFSLYIGEHMHTCTHIPHAHSHTHTHEFLFLRLI